MALWLSRSKMGKQWEKSLVFCIRKNPACTLFNTSCSTIGEEVEGIRFSSRHESFGSIKCFVFTSLSHPHRAVQQGKKPTCHLNYVSHGTYPRDGTGV
ncbi:hypothetical protein NPIL_639671 [Nephila pilipes]|uniref:Uncharacterized protein n=1 Tax=Nephila pilipes TaxID=299642 RepID=A0A8X6PFZ8_NEPPI|nr:hypothetical protein NPIL_639671 [Nephila pilipes]